MHQKLSSVRAPGDINCLPASIWQASVSFNLQSRLAPSWPLKGPFPLSGIDNLALAQDLCWTAWASHTKPAVRAAPSTRCSPAATTAACPTRTPSSAPTLTLMAAPLYSPSGPSRPAKRSDFATLKHSTAGSCMLHCGCGRLDTLSPPAFGKRSPLRLHAGWLYLMPGAQKHIALWSQREGSSLWSSVSRSRSLSFQRPVSGSCMRSLGRTMEGFAALGDV